MLRSILSVVAGTVTWGVLWVGSGALLTAAMPGAFREDGSTDSAGILAGFLVLSVALSILAGYVTATISRRKMLGHVVALAVLQLAVGILVQMQYWDVMPLWYHLTFLALLMPGVLVGGKIKMRRAAAA